MFIKNISKVKSYNSSEYSQTEEALQLYKGSIREKLQVLNLIFAKASIGDFSDNVELPDEEDEFTELYVGIQTMLEVIRDQLNELQELNQSLEEKVQKRTKDLNKSLAERIKSEKILKQKTSELEKTQETSLEVMKNLSIEIGQRKRVEKELRKTQATLEKQVHQRTASLSKANQNLKKEIQERKRIGKTLRKKANQLSHYQATLLELIKMDFSDLTSSLQRITELDAKTLKIERVSIWLFTEDRSKIICKDLYQLNKKKHSNGMEIKAEDYPFYFEAIQKETISAVDVFKDPRTKEFKKNYLQPNQIRSMMDIPIWLHGKIIGIICHEQTKQIKEWSLEEHDFIVSIAEITSLAILTFQRKQADEALVKKTNELARSNQELEQFAYIASHDLQEPLRMITSYTQLLSKRYQTQLGKEADDFIYYITDGAIRMQQLIEKLLQYSRIGRKNKEYNLVSCQKILFSVLKNLRASIQERRAKITYDPLPTLFANELELQQLFQNLISNAIKFTQDKIPIIKISAKKENKQWFFSIKDNGIGIDPQYSERIFIIFQRLHPRDEYPGAGIGLATCKKIIEQHGGKIWLASTPGKGTTFYFTLPAN